MTTAQSSVQGSQHFTSDARPRAYSGFYSIAISKNIEVAPSSGSSYYVPVADAKALVAQGDAIWDGPRKVIRIADKSKRGIWEPAMSGYAGPLTMQLT